MKLSFRGHGGGGQAAFAAQLQTMLSEQAWIARAPATLSAQIKDLTPMRGVGVQAIMDAVKEERQQSGALVADALSDLDKLMRNAKELVAMADRYQTRLAHASSASLAPSTSNPSNSSSGSIASAATAVDEAERRQFQEYLLNMGISAPVTQQTHGSAAEFHRELSRQLSAFLQRPLEQVGGMMTLVDAYSLFNRARGVELVSPDDMVSACTQFDALQLPVRMRHFESGVITVELRTHSDRATAEELQQLLHEHASLTAVQLARHKGIGVGLARHMLLVAEQLGVACRDDSPEGLRFFENKFAQLAQA